MFKRPSSRRRNTSEQVQLNLVPILDTMVTLIGFMLYTSSFMAIVSVETVAPVMSTAQVQKQLQEKPLQLTLSVRTKDTEIWSPFEKFKAVVVPHTPEGEPDLLAIHDNLVTIKQRFPNESKVVLSPHSGLSYDSLVAVLDSARSLAKTDPVILAKNVQSGAEEPVKALFPDIIFGNIISGGE